MSSKKENKDNLVWYLSYGSNLNEWRLMKYIEGGKPNHRGNIVHPGCSDKTPPKDVKERTLENTEVYFSFKSRIWNGGGVCFIKPNVKESSVLCRMYLITKEQFVEIMIQENHLKIKKEDLLSHLEMELEKGYKYGDLSDWLGDSLYSHLVYLGEEEGIPILSFTCKPSKKNIEYIKPTIEYLHTISKGLIESGHHATMDDALKYLHQKKGCDEHDLDDLIEKIKSVKM
eukprot:gene4564-7948_t